MPSGARGWRTAPGSGCCPTPRPSAPLCGARPTGQVVDRAGVGQAGGVRRLVDIVEAIGRQGVPQGPRVGLLSNPAALGAALRGAADQTDMQVVVADRSVPLAPDPRLIQRA